MSVSERGAPQLRSLPPPVIDPDDVAALVPGLSPEDAELYASLATLALEAVCWPNSVPDPLPPPVQAAGLAISVRLARAGESGTGAGMPVVSESIGSYTYRLATPETLDAALALTEGELDLLRPWLGQARVYDVSVAGWGSWLPLDWWQRDLDHLDGPPAGAEVFAP
jgi:hypothetical protein